MLGFLVLVAAVSFDLVAVALVVAVAAAVVVVVVVVVLVVVVSVAVEAVAVEAAAAAAAVVCWFVAEFSLVVLLIFAQSALVVETASVVAGPWHSISHDPTGSICMSK